ncbi:MAG: hypothetical protein RIS94_3206, partial [Pseudomonadota bacterium]
MAQAIPGEAEDAGERGARARLVALAAGRGISLSALSALIGRNTTYLQQFVRKGSPRKLEETDRRTLAEFFGVAESEVTSEKGFVADLGADSLDTVELVMALEDEF